MQSTWNSWPHGSFITRLMPSTYSSRHTTHSLHPLQPRWKALPTFWEGEFVLRRWGACGVGALLGGTVVVFSSPLRAAGSEDEREGNVALIGGVTVD